MAINDMTIEQASAVFTQVYNQATGSAAQAPVNTSQFVTMGQTALKNGYDPLLTAFSQVISRTVFTIRPYYRQLRVMEADEVTYGNHIRKLNYIDGAIEDDERLKLINGQSIDMYKVAKPQVVQTNFYGYNEWQKHVTRYRDQINTALKGPEEFARFIAGVMQNSQDQIETVHENVARFTLTNLIGGTMAANRYIDLLALYNTETGQTLTAAQVKTPQYFPDFARFVFAVLKTYSRSFKDRTVLHHTNLTDATPVSGNIMRHTPTEDQRLITYAPFFDRVDANVLSNTFNDEYLRLMQHDEVSFWNNPLAPQTIDVTASYTDTDGTIKTKAIENDNVLMVLFDREAAGYNVSSTWAAPTPFNVAGGYTNFYWHFTDRYWNDSTENCVVFGIGPVSA